MHRRFANPASPVTRHGLARVISKMGLASRTQAAAWIAEGRVRVNGKLVREPEYPVRQGLDRVEVSGLESASVARVVIMLNKPRGLLTTTSDEKGRETVYSCLADSGLPWLAPVGRLDKASEGLLLMCNDPAWAAAVTSPEIGPRKTYHVQVNRIPDDELLSALTRGIESDGRWLRAASARLLRHGQKHAWIEVELDEGRNRQIRRLLEVFDVATLRLVRVAIGPVLLGELAKGAWRHLADGEIASLGAALR